MKALTVPTPWTGASKLKYFLALSRTPHGIIDLATPALAALLWFGGVPPLSFILLGLGTAFAGYTAVYALNDLMDFRSDRTTLDRGGYQDAGDDLDALLVRHPLARGLLTRKEAVLWTAFWGLLALIGASRLSPWCVAVFLGGALLEMIYCLLWRTGSFRLVISGAVKTAGGMAAVLAVDPRPSSVFLLLVFLWVFFWEIGGQNIPNDWTDLEEDRRVQAETFPARFGPAWANAVIFSSLLLTIGLSVPLLFFSRMGMRPLSLAAFLPPGSYCCCFRPGVC